MPHKIEALVLDSWSVLAYFQDEPAGKQFADKIANAHESGIPLLMSVVNAAEVWYILAREVSEAGADNSLAELRQLGIELIDADWEIAQRAAHFKCKHKMSLADCFAAALAKEQKAELVTGDREFRQVENDAVKIQWLD